MVHITPQVIPSLGGGHTDTYTGCEHYEFLETRHAPATGQHAPGLKMKEMLRDIK